MSPAVVHDPTFQMLYRRVLDRAGDANIQSEYEDRSVIAIASSADGRHFTATAQPALTPAPPYIGLEDPTIVPYLGEYVVFYTGWTGWKTGQASLLWARGPSLDRLAPQGVALAPQPPTRFIKEAEYRAGLLWCEVDTIDRHERSRIALTRAATPLGPWPPASVIAEARPEHWDCVNISTGPLLEQPGRLYMLYNGMIKTEDPDFIHAARVGLMELDPRTGAVLARSSAPVLEPPPGANIAFAASLAGDILYYTVDDREIWAARLDRSRLGLISMEAQADAPRPPPA